jgi:two-component system, NarL family, response regulator DegU
MTSPIRVLMVDDELPVRNTVRRLLSTASNIHLVAEISEIHHLVARCLELEPHIVLIRGGLRPFIFDIPVILQQISLQAKIIALLNQHDLLRTEALLATHLAGCLFRQEIDENLVPTIHAVAQGATSFSRAVVERLATAPPLNQPPNKPQEKFTSTRLTRRDQQILTCLLRGYDNAQIGAELRLADQTVRNYVAQVCKKLGVPREELGRHMQTSL